jgi:hypothetical protein
MALSLYDIMAEDLIIYAKRIKGGIETRVTDENDVEVYREESHQAAWDSLVYFAKQVLAEDARMNKND